MNSQLCKLSQNIPAGIDAVMITSKENRRYYTGFPSSAGVLLLVGENAYFIIDSRYYQAAKSAVNGCKVILQEKLYEQITNIFREHDVKTLGIEEDSTTLSDLAVYRERLAGVEIRTDSGMSKTINRQRMIKTSEEIESMVAAQNIADETFGYITEFIEIGMTEKEIALEMEFYSRQNGSEAASFSFIVAAGENSAVPHAVPGGRKIVKGDFIVMDFGCTINGYCSDMTRTVAVGTASDKQRDVYNTVLKAQLAALDSIKSGMVCRDVDKIARDIIDNAGYKGMFGHGLGHSLGLEIHELPAFSPANETVLEPGIAMSVEPGIYIPGEFGVRIEDVVVITENGYKNLADSDKKLIIL